MNKAVPTRAMRENPDIDQLKRQAEELLEAFLAGEGNAVAEAKAHFREADSGTFALHDAQFVLARAYGFDSWPKLKAFVDGVTVRRLVAAVVAADIQQVRVLLQVRPELARMSLDNLQVLHHAVLHRSPDIVRLLMQHGASAREGVYPHREATSPLVIAADRGYDEIVAIIRSEEQARRQGAARDAPAAAGLFHALHSGDDERAIALLEADPTLMGTTNHDSWTPLHVAAWMRSQPVLTWLIRHGADVNRRGRHDLTPLEVAASRADPGDPGIASDFQPVAATLQRAGAALTARAAVALGDTAWIRARHAEGEFPGPVGGTGGLLRIAVTHNQAEMLTLLLDLGLDPDERVRAPEVDEVVYSWGFPLWECAATGKHEMAEMLLQRGADSNAEVYASGTPVHQAYGQRDSKMIQLLESHGGVVKAAWAGTYRLTDRAKDLLENAVDRRQVAEELLGGAACGGDPEIVLLALESIDWPPDDLRWFGVLEQPLRIWNHGPGHWCHHEWDRSTYLECFRLILERCDPNLRGRPTDRGQFGLTILHMVAGSRVAHMSTEERLAFATMLLDAGARHDVRDNLLQSTPLGWACRWGHVELVKLLLGRGADPVESDAEPWATPRAWAEKRKHDDVLALLREVAR